ncbi:hypothetical protein [Caballeronia sp. 15711]|uniref:hypothetical protein n=1 Tax=Caballeronia sp. 15711 TaxID=3391029 RepID=UPI0039E4C27C
MPDTKKPSRRNAERLFQELLNRDAGDLEDLAADAAELPVIDVGPAHRSTGQLLVSMAAIFPMMMHPHFVALTVMMIRRSVGRGDSAERGCCDSESDGDFLHGLFQKCEAGKNVVTSQRVASCTGNTDADIGRRFQPDQPDFRG